MSRLCKIWSGGDEWEGIILTLTVPPLSVISHFSCHGLCILFLASLGAHLPDEAILVLPECLGFGGTNDVEFSQLAQVMQSLRQG
jgi:hypothetical protein